MPAGSGGILGRGGAGGAMGGTARPPQSTQSLPIEHVENSEPEPPSSQSPSDAYWQSSPQWTPAGSGGIRGRGIGGGGDGAGGGGTKIVPGEKGGGATRKPQSTQSLPTEHVENSDPEPPSSQSPSDAYWH
eukprot:5326174-Prymnesium_polylepis.1